MNLELTKGPINKLLMKYSIPAIIGMIVVSLYNMVDRMFIGNIEGVGELALSGVGVTLPIVTILLSVELLIGIGVSTNISKSMGQGNQEEAERYLGQLIFLCVIIGSFIIISISLFKDEILIMFGASEDNILYARQYIDVILSATIFYMIGFSLVTTIRSEGNPKFASRLLIGSCIMNIVLDPIFIFELGIQGAAIATIISQIFVFIMAINYYTRGKSSLKLRKENLKLDKNYVNKIIVNGIPIFFTQVYTSLVMVLFNNVVKNYGGDLAIGAVAIILAISNVILMPVIGINQGSLPIIGFNYGAGEYNRSKQVLKNGAVIGTIIVGIGLVIILLFSEELISLFNKDKELLDISIQGLRIYLMMAPVSVISIVGANYFQSIGKIKSSIFLSLLRQVIIFIPLLIILPTHYGIIGVWMVQPISDMISALVSVVFLLKEFKNYDIIKQHI